MNTNHKLRNYKCIVHQILRQLTTEGAQRAAVVQSTAAVVQNTAAVIAPRTETGTILDLGTGVMNGEEDKQQETDMTPEEVHKETKLTPAWRDEGLLCLGVAH